MTPTEAQSLLHSVSTPSGALVLVLILIVAVSVLLGAVGWFLKDLRTNLKDQFREQGDIIERWRSDHAAAMERLRSEQARVTEQLRADQIALIEKQRQEAAAEIKQLRTEQSNGMDRVWHHISKFETALPHTYVLRTDYVGTMSLFDKKLDQIQAVVMDLATRKGGGGGGSDEEARS